MDENSYRKKTNDCTHKTIGKASVMAFTKTITLTVLITLIVGAYARIVAVLHNSLIKQRILMNVLRFVDTFLGYLHVLRHLVAADEVAAMCDSG